MKSLKKRSLRHKSEQAPLEMSTKTRKGSHVEVKMNASKVKAQTCFGMIFIQNSSSIGILHLNPIFHTRANQPSPPGHDVAAFSLAVPILPYCQLAPLQRH